VGISARGKGNLFDLPQAGAAPAKKIIL